MWLVAGVEYDLLGAFHAIITSQPVSHTRTEVWASCALKGINMISGIACMRYGWLMSDADVAESSTVEWSIVNLRWYISMDLVLCGTYGWMWLMMVAGNHRNTCLTGQPVLLFVLTCCVECWAWVQCYRFSYGHLVRLHKPYIDNISLYDELVSSTTGMARWKTRWRMQSIHKHPDLKPLWTSTSCTHLMPAMACPNGLGTSRHCTITPFVG